MRTDFAARGPVPALPLQRVRRGVEHQRGDQLRLVAQPARGDRDVLAHGVAGGGVEAVALPKRSVSSWTTLTSSGGIAELVGGGRGQLRLRPLGRLAEAQHRLAGRVHPDEDRSVDGTVSHARTISPGTTRRVPRGRCALRDVRGNPRALFGRCSADSALEAVCGAQVDDSAHRGKSPLGGAPTDEWPNRPPCRWSIRPTEAGALAPGAGRPGTRSLARGARLRAWCGRASARSRSASARGAGRRRLGARPGRRLGLGPGGRLSPPGRAPPARAAASSFIAARLWPLTRASQCGRAAAMPPVRGLKPGALARGLTQTIRWARRDSRSISRPTSAGSARSQPSERITTTAPRAMPAAPVAVVEPLQRLADAGAARPVGRRGGGALDRRLRVAPAQRAGEPGQPGGEHERLRRRPARHRRAQQLKVGAPVGLHGAGDVAEQTRRRGAVRRRRRTRRIGSPPARMLARSVAAQVEALAAAGPAHAPLAPLRGRQLELGHHPPQPRQLVGRQRGEALLRQPLLLAGERQRHLDLARVGVAVARRGARAQARVLVGLAVARHRPRPLGGGRWLASPERRRVGVAALLLRLERRIEDGREHAVEGRQLGLGGDEYGPRRPVELRARARRDKGRRAAKRAERSWVTGSPASRSRRPSAAARPARSSPSRRY